MNEHEKLITIRSLLESALSDLKVGDNKQATDKVDLARRLSYEIEVPARG